MLGIFAKQQYDSNTKLLLHFDNNAINSSIYNLSVINNGVTFSNSIYKFGGYSANCAGIGYVTVEWSTNFDLGSNNWTIDGWFYPSSISGNYSLFGFNNDLRLKLRQQNSNLVVYASSNGSSWGVGAEISLVFPTANIWYHVAIVYIYSNLYTYINGILINTSTLSGLVTANSPLNIGAEDGGANKWSGYIDEFRISKGIARWTTNFTPPTQPYDR